MEEGGGGVFLKNEKPIFHKITIKPKIHHSNVHTTVRFLVRIEVWEQENKFSGCEVYVFELFE